MHLIAYVSEYVGNNIAKDGMKIMQASLRNNRERDVTAVLFYYDEKFIQVLEGDEVKLRELVEIIDNDSRHKNLSVFVDVPTLSKLHKNWNMDLFILADDDKDSSYMLEYFVKFQNGTLNYITANKFIESFRSFIKSFESHKLLLGDLDSPQ